MKLAWITDIYLNFKELRSPFYFGGERGIRTLDGVSPIHTFQACAFNHSATSPCSIFASNQERVCYSPTYPKLDAKLSRGSIILSTGNLRLSD